MEGFSFNYKQAITFLSRWARGVQVFANATSQRLKGGRRASGRPHPGAVLLVRQRGRGLGSADFLTQTCAG